MIIGFLAKKRCGKDTACDYIVKKYNYTKLSFAHPLKKCVKELFGFTNSQLNSQQKEIEDLYWGIKPRKVLQFLGTDVVRDLFPKKLLKDIGNDFWIKRTDLWYKQNYEKHKDKIVFSDVRFQNEVDYIHSINGIIVKINRENFSDDNHKSELEIDNIKNYDILIDNNTTKEEFYSKLEKIFN